MAMLCVQRCQKLFSPELSGLPLQLTTRGPEHSGFATIAEDADRAVQRASAIAANPATLDCLPVSEMVEDHAPMAPDVRRENRRDRRRTCAMLAADRTPGRRAGRRPARHAAAHARGAVHAPRTPPCAPTSPMLDEDRPLGPDIETVGALLRAGRFAIADLLAR